MMERRVILRTMSKFFVPVIVLFAFYVQFHGELGPGGGFQAWVILGAAYILYALIFGTRAAERVVPPWVRRLGLAVGVLIYGGTGVVGLLRGANYLNYSVLAADPAHGQELGIFTVELGVGITVAAAMITIFLTFVAQLPRSDT